MTQRQQRHIARIDQHRLAQTPVGDHQFELRVAFADLAEHPKHPVAAEEQRVQRADRRRNRSGLRQVDVFVHLGRHLGDDKQARLAFVAHGDRLRADCQQHLVLQQARQAFGVFLDQNHRNGGCGAEPLLQPAKLEVGDRRNEDQHFGDEHEQHGQHEKLGRQPTRQRNRSRRALDCLCRFVGNACAQARFPKAIFPDRVGPILRRSAEDPEHPYDASGNRVSRLSCKIGHCRAFANFGDRRMRRD